MAVAEREFDLVLFGATGFTGGLTARYLAKAGDGTRWALAGRNTGRLRALADELGVEVPVLKADVTEPGSLREVADRTRVLITTVGPYQWYGEPAVRACAEAGTDYVDLTGEPEFVDTMYVRYHELATKTGARLVHCCGYDSIPFDLGVYYTVQQLPEGVPIRVDGFARTNARLSGGTARSALTAMSRGRQTKAAGRQRRAVEPEPAGREVRGSAGRWQRDRESDGWAVPLPTIDPQVVRRSAAALPRYGPRFRYRHHMVLPNLAVLAGMAAGTGALSVAAQVPPLRRWLGARIPAGHGPSPQRRARSWFTIRFVGEGGGQRVVTTVAGGDPGYDETAKMLAESGLCLAHDELPDTSGQVTTAVAMGDALLDRLRAAGITVTTLS